MTLWLGIIAQRMNQAITQLTLESPYQHTNKGLGCEWYIYYVGRANVYTVNTCF